MMGDGIAKTPPMGWRSWNLYGPSVDQDLLIRIMDGLTAKRGKERVSLCDLGYCHVGLDDNWQTIRRIGRSCTYHDPQGNPLINRNRFPDMKQLTNYGHDLGLSVGWYFNNCYDNCHEKCPPARTNETTLSSQAKRIGRLPPPSKPTDWNPRIYLKKDQGLADERCYQGDVTALVENGFDGVKLDACGWQMDLDLWYDLITRQADRPILIEACHWGYTVPDRPRYEINPETNVTEDTAWCPFHFFRTSGDIWASYGSIMAILQYTFQFKGLSRPGCWAHLDMLEVGCAKGPNGQQDVGLSIVETKTHFAAWAIMSSPLFLSHDVTNETIMRDVWPIISNPEIIAVNQAWAGFSGGRFFKSVRKRTFLFKNVPRFRPGIPVELFLYKPLVLLKSNGRREQDDYQSVAVLLINSDSKNRTLKLDLRSVPGLACAKNANSTNCEIRDIWERKSLGIVNNETMIVPDVASHGCAFYIIGTPRPKTVTVPNILGVVHMEASILSGLLPACMAMIFATVLASQRSWLQKKQRRRKQSKKDATKSP